MSAASLAAEADRRASTGDLEGALTLLAQAAEADPGELALWMKLAAVSRAAGKPRRALDAVNRALALAPLDFMGLTMKASLLERLGDPQAGEAWGRALAQQPDGELPPQLAAVIAGGKRTHEAWLEERDRQLSAAMADAESTAGADARQRLARFRSNVLRKTRPYHSEPTHFHFPGLVEREFHPRGDFPWLADLEAATETIASELAAAMASERAELVPYIQYPDHEPLAQWRPLNRNPDWTAIHLLKNGNRVDANVRHCPATMALLERLPQPDVPGASPNAMFSLLAPRTAIPPHVGVANTRLVCHLPLVVPDGCWFRVGAETRFWRRGEAFLFDDTIEHEAMNPSDELRVVFIFDVWHPGLSPIERDGVARLIAASSPGVATGL